MLTAAPSYGSPNSSSTRPVITAGRVRTSSTLLRTSLSASRTCTPGSGSRSSAPLGTWAVFAAPTMYSPAGSLSNTNRPSLSVGDDRDGRTSFVDAKVTVADRGVPDGRVTRPRMTPVPSVSGSSAFLATRPPDDNTSRLISEKAIVTALDSIDG